MRVHTIIKGIHFGLRPPITETHFRARKAGPTRIIGARYTSQTRTAHGDVIQREYADRAEWAAHRAEVSAKLASYHRQHGKLAGCQCAHCGS